MKNRQNLKSAGQGSSVSLNKYKPLDKSLLPSKKLPNKIVQEKGKELTPKILLTNKSSSLIISKNSNQNTEKEKKESNSEVFNLKAEQQNDLCSIRKFNQNRTNTPEDIKNKCIKIFDNFAKFSKDEGKFFLSHQSLIKILKYVNIISQKLLKLSDVDMILKKVCNGTKLNHDQFLDFIVQLSMRLDPENFENFPKETSVNVMRTFFMPFVEYMEEQNCSIDDPLAAQSNLYLKQSIITFLTKFEIDPKFVSLINSIYNTLRHVYSAYFNMEQNTCKEDKILQGSFNNYLEFNKDFEISPYLLNINQIVCYWNYVNNIDTFYKNTEPIFEEKKDLGKVFTLSKFSIMIIHFGLMTFGKINQVLNSQFSELEKLLFFLEKLENSSGFKNFERKTNKPHNSLISFIPHKNLIKNLVPNSAITSLFDENEIRPNEIINVKKLKEFNHKSAKITGIDLKNLFKVGTEVIEKIDSKLEFLKEIYNTYAKYGDKLSDNKMNYAGFHNFLKDSDLIHQNKENMNDLLSFRTFKSPGSSKALTMRSNPSSPKKFQSSILIKGKIIESEVFCVFCSLTGFKNFDSSEKYKKQLDKNKGYSPLLGETGRVANFSKTNSLSSSRSNVPMRMDFNLFLKSLEVLSAKLHPEKSLDEAIIIFLERDLNKLSENQINKVNNGKDDILEILQTLRKEEIVDLIKDIHQVIMIHYDNYCDSTGYIGFDNFFRFYKDFSIFPDVVNLVQVKNIFFALADIFYSHFYDIQNNFIKTKSSNTEMSDGKNKDNDNKIKNLLNKKELINFDLFLDSLAISSTFTKFSEKYDEVEKILYLIEKMNQSKGLSMSQFKSGQTFNSIKDFSKCFTFLREKYPSFYEKKQSGIRINKDQVKFCDIFSK